MKLRGWLAGVSGLLALALASAASAAFITVGFTGTVLEADDPEGITNGSVGVGAPVTGSLTFDDNVLPNSPGFPNLVTYSIPTPPSSMTIHAGSYTLDAAGLNATVVDYAPLDDPYSDVFQILTTHPYPGGLPGVTGANASAHFGLVLADSTRNALSSGTLAAVPLTLAAWNSAEIDFGFDTDTGSFQTVIRIDSLPEPSVFALALAACALFAGARARVTRI